MGSIFSIDPNLLKLIGYHMAQHPGFGARDAYKLLHQHFFGSEHWFSNLEQMKEILIKELNRTKSDDNTPLIEPLAIDFSIFRVNLSMFKWMSLDPEKLLSAFIEPPEDIYENAEQEFKKTWMDLIQMARGREVNLNADEMEDLVKQGVVEKCIPVHHSDEYVRLNNPAYRVVRRDAFFRYFPELRDKFPKLISLSNIHKH